MVSCNGSLFDWLRALYLFFKLYHLHFQITFISSYDIEKHSNITEIDAKLPTDHYMPNNFQYTFWQTSIQLLSLVPKLCVEALGREEVQKLNVEDFDLVFISSFLDHCFYSLFDDTKVRVDK